MQSNTAKAAVAIGSIAVVVVLFVVLSGGSDDDSTTTTAAETTTTAAEDTSSGTAEGAEKPPKPAEPSVPLIKTAGGEPTDGVTELTFDKGDEVRFEVISDIEEEVHVHGYDVYADLIAGKPAEIAFPASIDGVFEVELHGTAAPIAEITVNP